MSVPYEGYSFEKRVVRTTFDIYVLIPPMNNYFSSQIIEDAQNKNITEICQYWLDIQRQYK
jgi:hypothetical protein